jgi:hypothetical protein
MTRTPDTRRDSRSAADPVSIQADPAAPHIKGLAGLDQHQVRRWNSWHRWTTLAMLASAFLAILAAAERTRQPPPDDMIPLTSSEIHHLLNVLPDQPGHSIGHHLHWSTWRRQHQHRARTSHCQQRVRT